MRIAVLSDIHGNITALEAVLADLRTLTPDLFVHAGDLADSGSSGADVVDCLQNLGCQGVLGNTDEMLIRPESLAIFAAQSAAPPSLWALLSQIAAESRERLGPDRLEMLTQLPLILALEGVSVVHASPASCWRAPAESGSDAELEATYETLEAPVIVFGHTHRPGVRRVGRRTMVNSGSVGLPYDGDSPASYALLDDGCPSIRRVPYDLEWEIQRLRASGMAGAEWTERMLRTSAPQLP